MPRYRHHDESTGRVASVPRIVAPPEVSRAPADAIARDDLGAVGIRAADRADGLALIGGSRSGKTSLLCRAVRADALDRNCAMVVLVLEPGDAAEVASLVPPHRTVHYLDLRHPEFGINPLLAAGDHGTVARMMVEALGEQVASARHYLEYAAQAAIGACRAGVMRGPPALWHMYRLLLPSESAFRRRVVAALLPDTRFTGAATFFGRELGRALREAPDRTAAMLDASLNELLALMAEPLDRVMRHPRQLSLGELVSRREVLVVDGGLQTVGTEVCRVTMRFILNALHGALRAQQRLPRSARARVALKLDDAHLLVDAGFAGALAGLRSAGLEIVAAWQPVDRGLGMLGLVRQRCVLATANLPHHHAICSWTVRGARVPAFVAQTIPRSRDEVVGRHHRAAQRARGCFVPDVLDDPLPEVRRQLWCANGAAPIANVTNGAAAWHASARPGPGDSRPHRQR